MEAFIFVTDAIRILPPIYDENLPFNPTHMSSKKDWIKYMNLVYLIAYVFIAVGTVLIHKSMDIKVFFAFYELLYIPIVFGLPLLSIILMIKCFRLKNKSSGIYLCLAFAGLTIVLFGAKMYYLVFEKTLIF